MPGVIVVLNIIINSIPVVDDCRRHTTTAVLL